MKRLCIIPARGGSKRLLGKNLRKMNGLPLICYTIEAALGLFDKIIITSDSDEILETIKKAYKCGYNEKDGTDMVVLKRPDELATDTSKVIDTVSYYFDENSDEEFDQIWLCLPTCPLRTKDDISNAQTILRNKVDGVISVTDYEFPPSLGLLEDEKGHLVAYDDSDPWRTGNSRSQDHPTVIRPNGAIYGMWSSAFSKYRNFYKGEVVGYHMPRDRSVDIDTKFDFLMAESIMKNNKIS